MSTFKAPSKRRDAVKLEMILNGLGFRVWGLGTRV